MMATFGCPMAFRTSLALGRSFLGAVPSGTGVLALAMKRLRTKGARLGAPNQEASFASPGV